MLIMYFCVTCCMFILLLYVYMCVDSEGVRESTISECPGATHEDPGRPGVHLEEGSGGGDANT